MTDNKQSLSKSNSQTTGQYSILNKINSPEDLRALPVETLPAVCEELRRYIISNLSHNPGHFASSMGAVEIIVALHYVYDTPNDHIVFDVGHQAYAHKILTGRRDAFPNQRTRGGISGFPNPAESPYDTFVAGHAGNSISAALGMAIADNLSGNGRKSIALVGDASISNGLSFEGLNNVSNNSNNLLIVLNDNEMSIDNNVGALHRYLSNMSTSAGYNRMRFRLANFFRKKGVLTERKKGLILRFLNAVKSLVSRQQNIFEGLNIRYFGPFDGHDVIRLVKIFREIKDMEGPRLLHLHTVKGKGFPVAEDDPTTWHAPGKFDPSTGARIKSSSGRPKWQDVFGETLIALAKEYPEVVGITAAMPTGTSMIKLSEVFPDRTFDVGISEGHAVTFAGGLASAGKHPFVAIYSSFLQRAYDNIIHDVAIQGLPVTFCLDRAGLVGEDGVTHHGLFDLAYLNVIPSMLIASPADAPTLRNLMLTGLGVNGPMAIRYPRGSVGEEFGNSLSDSPMHPLEIGKGRQVFSGDSARVALCTLGPICGEAVKAARNLKEAGIGVDVYDMIWMKPLDKEMLCSIADSHDFIVTLEDGARNGGFGQACADLLLNEGKNTHVEILAIPDKWISHATPAEQRAECCIDAAAVEDTVHYLLSR